MAKGKSAPRPDLADLEPDLPEVWQRQPWRPILIALTLIAIVAAIGVGLQFTIAPHPVSALAKCKTAKQIAPHLYSGRYDEYVAATGHEAPGMRALS